MNKIKHLRTCSIEGCDNLFLARGWCQKHYQRWKAHGDPTFVKNHYREDLLRLLSKIKIDKKSGCWEWQGNISKGYGQMGIRRGKKYSNTMAHIVSYELLVGPRVVGLHIDHLCFNKLCVNPAHLEMVTCSVNNYRRCARIRELRRIA